MLQIVNIVMQDGQSFTAEVNDDNEWPIDRSTYMPLNPGSIEQEMRTLQYDLAQTMVEYVATHPLASLPPQCHVVPMLEDALPGSHLIEVIDPPQWVPNRIY